MSPPVASPVAPTSPQEAEVRPAGRPTTHQGTDDLALERAVDLLSCMAHPVRLAVLVHLVQRGPTCVGALAAELAVEQSALSHHLRRLREARLVVGQRQGRHVVYRLHDAHVGCIVEDAISHTGELVASGS